MGNSKKHIVSLPTTFFLVKAIYWLGGESLMMKCQWIVHSWFARQASKHLKGSELFMHGPAGLNHHSVGHCSIMFLHCWSDPQLIFLSKVSFYQMNSLDFNFTGHQRIKRLRQWSVEVQACRQDCRSKSFC